LSKAPSISTLKSLCPKSQAPLERDGITSINQLKAMGAVAAYVQAKRTNSNVSLNLLWGLESTLTGEPWQEVARKHRTSLLLAAEDCEQSKEEKFRRINCPQPSPVKVQHDTPTRQSPRPAVFHGYRPF
jgi:DNA transformation protein